MKPKKRVLAMLFCVAMALSLCMPFADAADIPIYGPYATLDDIPEDVNIFRSIRTGQYYYVYDGDYYQFYQTGYPKVRIKPSAFTTAPTNAYLDADLSALSSGCKNEPTESMRQGGISRVCYYKNASKESYHLNPLEHNGRTGIAYKYTVSMYRLELQANAYRELTDRNVYIQAKMTSGVTFTYDTGVSPYDALGRQEKIAIRPSVSINTSNYYNQVVEYQVMNAFGPYSNVTTDEIFQTINSAVGCASGILGLVADGDTIEKVKSALDAVQNCTAVVGDIVKYSTDHGYSSDTIKTWDIPVVVSPIRLTHSDNYVEWRLKFRDDIRYKDVNIKMSFI